MKRKLKSLLALALCAVGLSAFAKEPDAVQLWKDGPYFATSNLGTSEVAEHPEYGALYKFDDAGTAVKSLLGDEWNVPSKDDLKGLLDSSKCTKAKVTDDAGEFLGYTFTGATDGYTDKSIFLPAAGFDYTGHGRGDAGNYGCYWSSTEEDSEEEDSDDAWYLVLSGSGPYMSYDARSDRYSVRAVRDTPPTPTPPPAALAVANVKTATHWPWDGKIDVTCDLTGAGKVQLSAALTTNGVTVCTAKAENITGETVIDLDQVGGVTNGVKFTWDAKADCPADFNSKDTKVKVTAKKVPPPPAGQLWEGGPIWAEANLGEPEEHDPPYPSEYGARYKFGDAAQAVTDALGTEWRVPSDGELEMLAGKNKGAKVCSNVWTTCNGVVGRRFFGMTSGYEDKSIFLPAAGYGSGKDRSSTDQGYYWSSATNDASSARCLVFGESSSSASMNSFSKFYRLSVRAVRDAK